MDSLVYIHLNINLVYVTLFSMLGLFTTFMHIPNDSEFSGYRKARLTLGGAFFFMAVYCVVRFFMPTHQNDYLNFWLLMTVSLDQPREFPVEGDYCNTVTVREGGIAITASDCPGQDCVHSGAIHSPGRSLVCLPNALEIRVVSGQSDVDFVVG